LHADSSLAIIPVIIAIILSSLFVYFDNKQLQLAGVIFFSLLCLLLPSYVIFLPLICYDIFQTKYQSAIVFVPFILLSNYANCSKYTISFTLLFLLVSFLAKYKTIRLTRLTADYNDLRDNSVQMSILLKEKNQNLLQNQDYEINLATLNERNRISKEIHDNIGHLLSRALLQIGALLIVAKDEAVKEGLTDLKGSLSAGMDQIRSSIHNMYDESIDLYVQIERLVKDFTFCKINYEYDINTPPPLSLKQSLIAITKESLANIIRHSNANEVSILFREHPAMYQLIIRDNGNIDKSKKKIIANAFESGEFEGGMGLRNINDRVKSFGGNINVSMDQGFMLFISIPKKAA
jgi:signal transduction histidine kinase